VTSTPTTTPTTSPRTSRGRRLGFLGAFLALSFLAGFIGSVTQGDDVGGRYLALELPTWAPPQEAFGLVWPVLYVLIGVAAWRVWDRAGGAQRAGTALNLWFAQLVVNAAWPAVFFGAEAFGPAIGVIVVLVALVVATIAAFARHDRLAAGLLVPYLLWISYATALNVAIWTLN
jgi:benzodiazapine receptor